MDHKKISVTLLVCAVLAGGFLAAGFLTTNGTADDGSGTTYADVTGASTVTLNVTVYANVGGTMIPIEGANVTIYEVTVEENDTVTTITLEKIAVAETGEGGLAQIALPEGNYTIVVDYYGLRSVGELSTDSTENVTMVLGSAHSGPGEFPREMNCPRHHGMHEGFMNQTEGNMAMEMVQKHL
ncbi:MAG: hypothetical protein A4E32_00111 [Methanomassiliicoccales archaeon PtaU1.Bin124]|nr:MAG: hypothetical protein A4E32_00111 [Methanomassiliicoccales archaeon PtaU1.Bin124]